MHTETHVRVFFVSDIVCTYVHIKIILPYLYTFCDRFIYRNIDLIIKYGQVKLVFPYKHMNHYRNYSLDNSTKEISTISFLFRGVIM